MFIERYAISQLTSWKDSPSRKPLILLGARQVGKTALLKHFGKSAFNAVHVFDFEASPLLASVFEKDLDTNRIIRELAFHANQQISIESDLIIFDELQACGRALTSLKYFCEQQPSLALACAGSLLGLALPESSFPVGKVSLLHLSPLTYAEFLGALGQQHLLKEIAAAFSEDRALSIVAHEKLLDLLKLYLFSGGLPEIVATLAPTPELELPMATKIRDLQTDLLSFYAADMAKHCGKVNAMHIERLWRAIPEQLARGLDGSSKKFTFKDAVPGLRSYERLAPPLDWLEKAGLVLKIPLIEHAEIPLRAYAHETIFKLYSFDVGILGAMLQIAPYDLLKEKMGSFKGYLLENFVAQELQAKIPNQIFSWRKKESEIEFLIQRYGTPFPIEVKAGHNLRARSLKIFRSLYTPESYAILSVNNLEHPNRSPFFFPHYLAHKLTEGEH